MLLIVEDIVRNLGNVLLQDSSWTPYGASFSVYLVPSTTEAHSKHTPSFLGL